MRFEVWLKVALFVSSTGLASSSIAFAHGADKHGKVCIDRDTEEVIKGIKSPKDCKKAKGKWQISG